MARNSALRIQNLTTVASALSTLAANAALVINTDIGTAMGTPFLMKKLKIHAMLAFVDDGDGNLCIGLARGDANAAEIAAAMNEFNREGPQDTTESLTEDDVWTVIQNSVVWSKPTGESDNAAGGHYEAFDGEISFGKGIPALEDQGVAIFIYNGGPTMTTGSLLSVHAQIWGVWLG